MQQGDQAGAPGGWRRWLPWRRGGARSRVRLNLALQGGGAHGAFTWGVLDRLLDEHWLDFEGLSGASAGAMNATVFASGWEQDGRAGARAALERFWRKVSGASQLGPLRSGPLDYLLNGWNRDLSPGYLMMSALTKLASPYQFNPTGYNPLLQLLNEEIDFDGLRRARHLQLFVAVTNVHSGQLRVLRNHELSAQALLASACLPQLFHAVQLEDGAHYWDGGYTANPPLFPLISECQAYDLLLVQLEPSWRASVPTRLPEIIDRANEIAFNANLLRELQMLAMLERPAERSPLPRHWVRRPSKRLHVHHVEAADAVEGMGRTSRINAEWGFLQHLCDQGRQRADDWLRQHGGALGRRSSMDLSAYR